MLIHSKEYFGFLGIIFIAGLLFAFLAWAWYRVSVRQKQNMFERYTFTSPLRMTIFAVTVGVVMSFVEKSIMWIFEPAMWPLFGLCIWVGLMHLAFEARTKEELNRK